MIAKVIKGEAKHNLVPQWEVTKQFRHLMTKFNNDTESAIDYCHDAYFKRWGYSLERSIIFASNNSSLL